MVISSPSCRMRDPARTVRARAVLNGRFAPSLDDVAAMAYPVLRHRMALSFAARARGDRIDDVIARLTADRARMAA